MWLPCGTSPQSQQLSFSLYVCGALQTSDPHMEPKVSARDESLCVGPLRGYLSFQQPSLSCRQTESMLFHSQMLCGPLFLPWVFWCGAETLAPLGPLKLRSLPILNHHTWVQGQPVHIYAPLTSPCSFFICLVIGLAQLVLRWLSRLIIL